MATASDIISRALRIAGVIDASEAMSADDAQDALETLNAMLAEWHEAGIGLPDYSFTSLTDTLATDAADREAIAYQLALRLATEYGKELLPTAQAMAEQTMGRLRLRYFQEAPRPNDLPRATRSFDIDVIE